MSNWERFKQQIVESQVWRSIFRHGYEDTPRNRILAVSGNVWLHFTPTDALRGAGLLIAAADHLIEKNETERNHP